MASHIPRYSHRVSEWFKFVLLLQYPLVKVYIALENGPVEIVDFPSYNMVMFHSYVIVYQGVPEIDNQGSGKIMEHV